MYKVFINEKTIYLTKKTSYTESESTLVYKYSSLRDMKEIFFSFKDDKDKYILIIYGKRKKKLLNRFITIFKLIEAAGGIVKNPKGEYLFIFRRGKWDLPKGKVDAFETYEKAALREVEEECGINGLKIQKPLPSTYHIYFHKQKWVMKRTYWFEMHVDKKTKLTPQLEEDITEAKWISEKEIPNLMENTFKSIHELVTFYFQGKES